MTSEPKRIAREKQVVEQMIGIYCSAHHQPQDQFCPQCQTLLEYAHRRLSACRFGAQKLSCKKCPVHCYKPAMREQIRQVMRYAGPRMLLHHPLSALRHLVD